METNIHYRCPEVTIIEPTPIKATLYNTIDNWAFTIITPEDYE